MDDVCYTCGEVEDALRGECPNSKRECGHHCNCTWIHDSCCWCPAHVNDDGVFVKDKHPARGLDGVCVECGAGPEEFHRDGCRTVIFTPDIKSGTISADKIKSGDITTERYP